MNNYTRALYFIKHSSFAFLLVLLVGKVKAQNNTQLNWINELIERSFPVKEYQGKKIKSIIVDFDLKRENSRIEKGNKKYIYQYLPDGNLESLIETTRNDNGYDSIFTFCYYNNTANSRISRTYNKGRYTAVYQTFDEDKKLSRYVVCYETNLSDDFRFFKLGQQTVIQSESYKYEYINENQTRKKIFNDNNLVYKEGIIYTDEKNKKTIAEEYTFLTTGVRTNYKYLYDNKRRLTESSFYSDAAGELNEKTLFLYTDSVLNEDKLYRNNILKNERYYFYNKDSHILESILCKVSGSYLFEIYNFHFIFYP